VISLAFGVTFAGFGVLGLVIGLTGSGAYAAAMTVFGVVAIAAGAVMLAVTAVLRRKAG
jgi:hypothetical protein